MSLFGIPILLVMGRNDDNEMLVNLVMVAIFMVLSLLGNLKKSKDDQKQKASRTGLARGPLRRRSQAEQGQSSLAREHQSPQTVRAGQGSSRSIETPSGQRLPSVRTLQQRIAGKRFQLKKPLPESSLQAGHKDLLEGLGDHQQETHSFGELASMDDSFTLSRITAWDQESSGLEDFPDFDPARAIVYSEIIGPPLALKDRHI